MVKQRKNGDCAVCALAMMASVPWHAAARLFPDEAKANFAHGVNTLNVQRRAIDLGLRLRRTGNLRKGRPAIIVVDQYRKDYLDRSVAHAIYWDGTRTWCPSKGVIEPPAEAMYALHHGPGPLGWLEEEYAALMETMKLAVRAIRKRMARPKTTDMTDKQKKWIDKSSYMALLERWRNAPIGDAIFQGEAGDYYTKTMRAKRDGLPPGEHARTSKDIGWEKR